MSASHMLGLLDQVLGGKNAKSTRSNKKRTRSQSGLSNISAQQKRRRSSGVNNNNNNSNKVSSQNNQNKTTRTVFTLPKLKQMIEKWGKPEEGMGYTYWSQPQNWKNWKAWCKEVLDIDRDTVQNARNENTNIQRYSQPAKLMLHIAQEDGFRRKSRNV